MHASSHAADGKYAATSGLINDQLGISASCPPTRTLLVYGGSNTTCVIDASGTDPAIGSSPLTWPMPMSVWKFDPSDVARFGMSANEMFFVLARSAIRICC